MNDQEKKILKAISDLIRLEKHMANRDNYVRLGNLGYLVEDHRVVQWAEEIKVIKEGLKLFREEFTRFDEIEDCGEL